MPTEMTPEEADKLLALIAEMKHVTRVERRGRPRLHADDAAKMRAYRERKRAERKAERDRKQQEELAKARAELPELLALQARIKRIWRGQV
jgi:phage terminase Nu1 subunit (DNA packaging protein)